MINVLKPFSTPEYLYRPTQILRRFKRALRKGPLPEFEIVELPWGSRIRVRPAEVIGSNIYCYGLFDITVTEAVCRLLEEGEVGLDIGANIGQMTNLMRHRVGARGKVISFEPHPELFSELCYNANDLAPANGVGAVELHNLALSDVTGQGFMNVGKLWTINRGMAKIVEKTDDEDSLVPIQMSSLDAALDGEIRVGLCKIDVEGHELKVLKGAARLLAQRAIRDLVFEESDPYPSPVHLELEAYGFEIFSLHARMSGPRLARAARQVAFVENKEGKNYLATLEPARALAKFRPWGWECLRASKSS
jgi:FkbM family methyltransferase